MHYLTNYYKNLCEQLEDKIKILQRILQEQEAKREYPTLTHGQWDKQQFPDQDIIRRIRGELQDKHPNFIGLDTPRQALYRRYPKETVDSMIAAIREREKTHPASASENDVDSSSTVVDDMYKNFHVPDYSDPSIDRRIYVLGNDEKDADPGILAFTRTQPPTREKPYPPYVIKVSTEPELEDLTQQITWELKSRLPNYPHMMKGTDDSGKETSTFMPPERYNFKVQGSPEIHPGDIYGHEVTHTLFGPGRSFAKDGRTWPRMSATERETLSPEEAEEVMSRREYTQNAMEVPARFSELKHIYYNKTGKVLDANMTPEQSREFVDFVNKNFPDNPEFQDTMKVFQTPAGEELFRRTVRRDKPKSDTRMA